MIVRCIGSGVGDCQASGHFRIFGCNRLVARIVIRMSFFPVGVFQIIVAKPHVLEPSIGGYEADMYKILMVCTLLQGVFTNVSCMPLLGASC